MFFFLKSNTIQVVKSVKPFEEMHDLLNQWMSYKIFECGSLFKWSSYLTVMQIHHDFNISSVTFII